MPVSGVDRMSTAQIQLNRVNEHATEQTHTGDANWDTAYTMVGAIVVPAGEVWLLAAVHVSVDLKRVGGGQAFARTLIAGVNPDTQKDETIGPVGTYNTYVSMDYPPIADVFLIAGTYDILLRHKNTGGGSGYDVFSKNWVVQYSFKRFAVG